MSPTLSPALATILLLSVSNIFMTAAWYGHLKFASVPLWIAVLASWGIAFFEYCLVIPANRIGYAGGLSAGELKIIQEVITLLIFGGFAVLWLGEALNWRHLGAFLCMVGAVTFMFAGK